MISDNLDGKVILLNLRRLNRVANIWQNTDLHLININYIHLRNKLTTELTIVIPTYNEYENITLLVSALDKALLGMAWEVLFVDDDSPDGTADLVREIANENHHIRCMQRTGRRGRTSACIEGILASSSPYICVMDADLQHDEKLLPQMLLLLKQDNLDLVIGSRYIESGSTGSLPQYRVWISKLARKSGNFILKHPVSDPTSGFFMIQGHFFRQVNHRLSGKGLKGFELLLDILASADSTLRYKEIPYTMREREKGESKLNVVVIWEFFSLLVHRLISNRY